MVTYYEWYTLEKLKPVFNTHYFHILGANYVKEKYYLPQVTSYDFDAVMTEAGDPTPIKYPAVQKKIYEVSNYKVEMADLNL